MNERINIREIGNTAKKLQASSHFINFYTLFTSTLPYFYQMKHIVEANRYLDNSKEILSTKAQKEEGYYRDSKYIKMAGNTAYNGVLVALDGLLGVKKKGRKSVEWYKEELGKLDKKILYSFSSAYETLHLSMGYDGLPNAKIADEGLEEAKRIINWVAMKQEQVV